MRQVNVLTIDPSRLCREGLRWVLDGSEFTIVAEADSIAGMPERLSTTIDLVIVDLGKPDAASLDALAMLRNRSQTTRIVVLSTALETNDAAQFLESGADGCLLKETAVERLRLYLDLVMAGEKVLCSKLAMGCLSMAAAPVAHSLCDTPSFNGLTLREREILQHVADGASNKLIANRLGITETTVKVHLKTIMKKTNATNRTQVAIWASRLGLNSRADAL